MVSLKEAKMRIDTQTSDSFVEVLLLNVLPAEPLEKVLDLLRLDCKGAVNGCQPIFIFYMDICLVVNQHPDTFQLVLQDGQVQRRVPIYILLVNIHSLSQQLIDAPSAISSKLWCLLQDGVVEWSQFLFVDAMHLCIAQLDE